MGPYSQVRLAVYHRVQLGEYLRATRRCTWECLESLLGNVQSIRLGVSSSAIGSVLESLLGSVQSCRLGVCYRVQLGASLRECA
jgi:hypothetical protein